MCTIFLWGNIVENIHVKEQEVNGKITSETDVANGYTILKTAAPTQLPKLIIIIISSIIQGIGQRPVPVQNFNF
jgi:hypothetical protein